MPEASITSADALSLEMQLSGGVLVEGWRLTTEESDGSIVQEFLLPPDVAYELFLYFKQIDDEVFGTKFR